MLRLRSKLTFANVLSLVAVFIALGGVGYAAIKLPKNSVGTKQIKSGAVTQKKISASAQAALKGQKGDQGLQGPSGQPGAPGSAVAFAFVNTSNSPPTAPGADTVDESRSKGITDANVTHPANGIWCFDSLSFSFTNVVASSTVVDTTDAVGGTNGDSTACPGDEALAVSQANDVGQVNGAFMVLFN